MSKIVPKKKTTLSTSQTTPKRRMVAGGIGCFYFRPKTQFSDSVTIEDYVNLVKTGLETITSIRDVNITFDDFGYGKVIESGEFPKIHDDYIALPCRGQGFNATIQFDVYIPERIANVLIGGDRFSTDEVIETFSVIVSLGYKLPIAFIFAPVETEEENGSSFVVLVREFLTQQLETSDELELEVLGPSPFHANFGDCILDKRN